MLKKLSYLVTVALIVMVGTTSVQAAVTLHWTGQQNTTWHNPVNWDQGQVPGQDDDAFVDSHTGANQTPIFTSASTTLSTHSGFFLGYGNNGTYGSLTMNGGTITVASALRSVKNASPTVATFPVLTMNGGTINITGLNTNTGAWISANHGGVSWGEGSGNSPAVGLATWHMNGGTVLCGTLQLPPPNTNNHGVINLNGGVFSVREDSFGYGTTEIRGLFIGEDNARGTAVQYDGKLNITGGTLLCGSDVTALIDSYVAASPARIIAYPAVADVNNCYIVRDWNSRTTGKTTVTAATQPKNQAWKPAPINGDRFAALSPTLSWSKGRNASVDANSHDVYLGTSYTQVLNATTATAGLIVKSLAQTTVTNGPVVGLSYGVTYYWRVDEYYTAASLTIKGPVWSFTVTGRARDPQPNIADTIDPNYNGEWLLSWIAGTDATSHSLYLSTNSGAMGSAIYTGGTPSFNLTSTNKPVMGLTYYWRVDESPTGVTGDLWSFTVSKFRTVDSFEKYINSGELNWPAGKGQWKSLYGTTTLSLATGTLPWYTGSKGMHGGAKSMSLGYSLSGDSDEAIKLFSPAQDWSFANTGAKALTLYMRGSVANASASVLGVYLKSGTNLSAQVNHSTPNTIVQGEDWTEWNINIDSFANAGFNINAVTELHIRYTISGEGSNNMLWVDDVRMYPSRCVDQANDAGKADITNDCKIDNNDLDYIANDWLQADALTKPDGKFNPHMATPAFTGWTTSGKFGNAAQLNGTSDWMDIDDAALSSFYNKTISFWVKRNGAPTGANLWTVFGTSNIWRINMNIDSSGSLATRIGSSATTFGTTLDDATWTHIALTLTKYPGDTIVTGQIFKNGAAGGTGSAEPAHYYAFLYGAGIGALNNGQAQFANIAIDDFRIYDAALTDSGSPSDIDKLADNDIDTNPAASPSIRYDFNESSGATAAQTGSIGTTVYHPINYTYTDVRGEAQSNLSTKSPATGVLAGRQVVNFSDYAKLAQYWLSPTAIPVWP